MILAEISLLRVFFRGVVMKSNNIETDIYKEKMDWIISNRVGFVFDRHERGIVACEVDKVDNGIVNLHSMLSNHNYIKSIEDIDITLFHDSNEAEEHYERLQSSIRESEYWSELFGEDLI